VKLIGLFALVLALAVSDSIVDTIGPDGFLWVIVITIMIAVFAKD